MKLLFSVITQLKSRKITRELLQEGKEKDSFLAQKHMSNTPIITSLITSGISPRFCKKRVTSCTSMKGRVIKGSVTIEAALVVPIFLYAMLCIVYLLEILATQTVVRTSMNEVYQELSQEVYLVSYVSGNEVEEKMIACIGRDGLESSVIVDGSNGLDCSDSYVSLLSGIITLQVDYQVKLPFPSFLNLGLSFTESLRGKG